MQAETKLKMQAKLLPLCAYSSEAASATGQAGSHKADSGGGRIGMAMFPVMGCISRDGVGRADPRGFFPKLYKPGGGLSNRSFKVLKH